VGFSLRATQDGEIYTFKAGEVVRIKVFEKKACENVVLQKDFPVEADTETVEILLLEEDTRFGGIISKPTDYWYEVELNPLNNPQTIIGYDEDGAKIFKLFPEGKDDEVVEKEDIPTIQKIVVQIEQNEADIDAHKHDVNNPHKVTATQVGARPDTWTPTAEETGTVAFDKVQDLTDAQKLQARTNIGAAPAGYGWGETMAATMPDDDANNALTTGLYRAMITTANVPARCNLIFVQAAFGSIIYQTAYCDDGTLMRVRDHGFWSEWKPIGGSEKVYEHIATITVAPDADGSLPQHVIFTADSDGNAFQLSDFVIRAYAAFASGNKSSLYMAVNNDAAISNGAIGSLTTACRYFNIFFRQEADGCQRAEYTSSTPSDTYYNAQSPAEQSRLIPPMHNKHKIPFTKIDLYTLLPADGEKAWVEGSTFELWGVRV